MSREGGEGTLRNLQSAIGKAKVKKQVRIEIVIN